MGDTTGPDVTIFKTFKVDWNLIKVDRYKSGIRDKYVSTRLSTVLRAKPVVSW